jgi:hypothetical protein
MFISLLLDIYLGVNMPFPFKLKKTRYVLKARKYGSWEDIEEYDKKMSVSELSDTIEDLRSEGYDYVRLEEIDSEGKRVKIHWAKPLKPKGKKIKETLSEIQETVEALKIIKEAFKDENSDPYVVLASSISLLESFRKICDSYPALCGKDSSSNDPIMQFILGLIQSRLAQQPYYQYNQPQQQPAPIVTPSTTVIPKPSQEAVDKINKIVEEALDKAMKTVVSECQAIGSCQNENEEVE